MMSRNSLRGQAFRNEVSRAFRTATHGMGTEWEPPDNERNNHLQADTTILTKCSHVAAHKLNNSHHNRRRAWEILVVTRVTVRLGVQLSRVGWCRTTHLERSISQQLSPRQAFRNTAVRMSINLRRLGNFGTKTTKQVGTRKTVSGPRGQDGRVLEND